MRVIFTWIVLILLDIFVIRDITWIIEHLQIKRVVVNFVLSYVALLSFLFILRPIILNNKLIKTLVYLFIAIPLIVQSAHFDIYRSFSGIFGFYAFADDPLMVLELWIDNYNFFKILIILPVTYLLLIILFTKKDYRRIFKPRKKKTALKILYAVNFLFFISIYLFITFIWYGVGSFQNPVLSYYSTILQISRNQTLEFKRDKPEVQKSNKSIKNLPNIIFIVGESLTRSHMGIYGYKRDTTPNLQKLVNSKELIVFDNAISIGTHTRLSVPYMLSGIEGIDPKGVFYNTPSVLNYAKARGYNTAFISAQDTKWGHIKDLFLDSSVDFFWDGINMNKNASVHKGADDMRVLNEIVLPYVYKQSKPFFLVLQMDGSHYPFAEHYNQEHTKFTPEGKENSVNSYDNTVVKTDDYIATLVSYMRKKYPSSWVFYSADHGQDLGGKNGMFNNRFSSGTIHNALLISPPKNKHYIINKNIKKPVSQADIVPTILSIIDMKPSENINGLSLFENISPGRMRISSKYMPTQHNEAKAVLVNPDLSYYFIDFDKMSVVLPDGKSVIKFKDWSKIYQHIFLDKLPKKDE